MNILILKTTTCTCIFENDIDEEEKTLQKRYIESFQSDLSIHSVIENSWASVDWLIWFLVFNATFSNISAISWRPALVVEEAGVTGENHQPWASNW